MSEQPRTNILCIAGPTASGKSSRAVDEALQLGGEIVSVDSRQVYRGLDIGTEKIPLEERRGVPHHLLDIRTIDEPYSAAEFAVDAARCIADISARGKLPILVGGSHYYFDLLLRPLASATPHDPLLRAQLEHESTESLLERLRARDPRRASELDPHNRRRIIRAIEIVERHGQVAPRETTVNTYDPRWILIDPPREVLRARIDARLTSAIERGLIAEVQRVSAHASRAMLDELGLEYKIVGEYLRGERTVESLIPTLSAKLWQYARRQKAWLRKLRNEFSIAEEPQHPDTD